MKLLRMLLVTVVLAALLTGMAKAQEALTFATAKDQVLNVYWTPTAPAIDGKMDDACWRDAEVAGHFALFKKAGYPQNQTEVRLAYDAENLYVFWKLYEKDMDKLAMANPADTRDHIRWDDCPELFLDPGRTEKFNYQFATNPGALLYDGVDTPTGSLVAEFSPNWEAAAGRFEGGWTVEERIPFGELALPGTMQSTPQVGDHWGVTFCRNQAALHEWSQWVPTMMGFHDVVNNGHMYFRGRKDGTAIPAVTEAKAGALFYGPSALEFTVQNAPALTAKATFLRPGAPPQNLPATVQGGTVRIPYSLLEGGVSKLSVQLASGGTTFYTGQAIADLVPAREPLEVIAQQASAGQAALNRLGPAHPRMRVIAQQLGAFQQRLTAARAELARGQDLTAPEWQALVDQTNALQADWKKLEMDVALAQLYPGKQGQPAVAFAVGAGTESDKFYRDSVYSGSTTAPIRLSLAGNEFGSYQLAVLPFWRNLEGVSLAISDLEGPRGAVIPADACRWFRVGYVKLENVNLRVPGARVYEPDPLLPAAAFDVPAGEVGAVWVDLKLPAELPAGIYRGKVTVSAEGQEVVRNVEVKAYGFDIPAHSTFEADVWHAIYQWNHFYGYKLNYTPELNAAQSEVLGRYRVNSIPGDWITLCQYVPIYREADGHFSFDWTQFDKYLQNGLANGSHSFWCALSCNSGWTAWLNSPDRQIIDRATGEKHTLKEYFQPPKWDMFDPACYQNNPLYREFLVAYVEHLKELGINDWSYYELFDEPNDNSRWLKMIEHHRWFRQVVPDLNLLCFGVEPLQVKAGESPLGLIDAWAPHLPHITPEMDAAIKARRSQFGEKYWGYTCGEAEDGKGGYSPYIRYDRPYLSARMHYWFTWRNQMDGFLVFASSGVPDQNFKTDPAQRWPNSDWSDGGYRGCGTLIYPGPDYELIPGMRLANLRKGLEDQEYFALLRREAKALDPGKHAKLLAKVEQALEIEPDIITSYFVWTKDRNRLETKRDQLAALIVEVQAAVRR